MKNQNKTAYKAPRLARLSVAAVNILLTSSTTPEEPRGALSNLYTDGARAAIDWEEFFLN